MIQAFFDLPAATQFFLLALIYCGIAVLAHAATTRWRTQTYFVPFRGVAAPVIGAMGLLFGFLTGFLANDVAGHYRAARATVTSEANSLIALHTLAAAATTDPNGIRSAMRTYIRSELTDEWPRLADHGGRSPATDAAYRTLLDKVSTTPANSNAGPAVQANLLSAAMSIGAARSSRLSLIVDHSTDLQWACVLILALLTQLTIALVHLDRPAPQAAALALFTLATIVALSLIALQEEPFSGPLRLEPGPIEAVLQVIGES